MKHPILKSKFNNLKLSLIGYSKLPLIDNYIINEINNYIKHNLKDTSNTYINTILSNDYNTKLEQHNFLKKILNSYFNETFLSYKLIIATFFLKFKNPTQTVGPHIDPSVVNVLKYDDFIIWIPLVDTTLEKSGRISIQPFSHIFSRRLNLESKVARYFKDYKSNKIIYIKLKKGEHIIFFNNLLHGSEINTYYNIRPAISLKISIENAKIASYHIKDIQNGTIDIFEQDDEYYYIKYGWNELENPKCGKFYQTIYNYK
jgi:ectoine hydroxylase-related dioxygenase (phytanoyl-CoA dioxygenase family)